MPLSRPSPQVLVIVAEKAEDCVVLQSSGLIDLLDHISLFINNHQAVKDGAEGIIPAHNETAVVELVRF